MPVRIKRLLHAQNSDTPIRLALFMREDAKSRRACLFFKQSLGGNECFGQLPEFTRWLIENAGEENEAGSDLFSDQHLFVFVERRQNVLQHGEEMLRCLPSSRAMLRKASLNRGIVVVSCMLANNVEEATSPNKKELKRMGIGYSSMAFLNPSQYLAPLK